MLFLKLLFILGFVIIFPAGIIGMRRFDKWFGPDPNVPSQNESVTLLNKSQFVLVWLLTSKIFLMMALML